MPVKAAIFDYGGVLTTRVGDSLAAWMAADGIEPSSFTRTLKAWLGRDAPDGTPIHQLETGRLSVAAFNRVLTAELRTTHGQPVSPDGLLARLFAEMRQDAEMYQLARDLKDCGIRTAILSNSWGNTYPLNDLRELFDPIVISCEVGLRKPNVAIYELALERVGVSASEAVFIDDAEPNVRGAQAAGMRAIKHRSAGETRAALISWAPGIAAVAAR